MGGKKRRRCAIEDVMSVIGQYLHREAMHRKPSRAPVHRSELIFRPEFRWSQDESDGARRP
jgi:hypothetical protein